MSLHRLVVCALLGAPLLTFAQATPEGAPATPEAAPATPASASEAPAPVAAPAPEAAAAPAAPAAAPTAGPSLELPFTRRGRAVADAELRGGPDKLSPARATLPAGAPVVAVPGTVRGFVRVRVASGESGYVPEEALELGPPEAAPAAAQAAPPVYRPPAPPPAPAASPPRAGGPFAHLGVAIPADSYLEGFGNGLSFEAGFALPWQGNTELEFSIGYSKHAASLYGVEMEFRSIPLLAGFRFVTPSPSVDLYGIVGAGLDFVSLEGTGYGVTITDSATAPVFHIGAGLGFRMGGGRFDLLLRYWAGTAKLLEAEGGIDTASLSAGFAF